MSTIKTINIQHPSSASVNLTLTNGGATTVNGAFTLPAVDGINGQVLTTNGSGVSSWGAGTPVTQDTYDSTPGSPWSKPSVGTMALIECWGGGGGAGRTASAGAGGGGGGAYAYKIVPLSQLGATETVTVGAGGTGRTGSAGAGTAGGNSSFGSWVIAYGGAGGANTGTPSITTYAFSTSNATGGGGTGVTGEYIMPTGFIDTDSVGTVTYSAFRNPQTLNGGHGYMLMYASAAAAGSSSLYGGGGGGGGLSQFGGDGGTRAATPTVGAQPGGGGGPSSSINVNGASGGAGRVRITVW